MVLLVHVWVRVKLKTVPELRAIMCAVTLDVTVIPIPSVKVCDVPVTPFNDLIATTAGRLAKQGGIPAPLAVNPCPAFPVATDIGFFVESYEIRLTTVSVASFAVVISLSKIVYTPAFVILVSPYGVWFFHAAGVDEPS